MISDTSPQFELQLNAAGIAQYGMATLHIGLTYEQTPIGYGVQVYEHRADGWGTITSFYDKYGGDITPEIAEMNATSVAAWIKAHICPLVEGVLRNIYGALITSAAPAPPVTTVTQANVVQAVNDALAGFKLMDTNGNGIPELVLK